MSIQSNVNTALSLASLLATQNPALRAKAEKRAELKSLGRKEEVLSKAVSESGGAGDSKIAQELTDQLGELKKQQFELDPSAESFQAYRQQRYHTTEGQKERTTTVREDPQAVAEELYEKAQYKREVLSNLDAMMNPGKAQEAAAKAQEATKVAQEQKRATRRKFTDYLKDEPTSLGGTFSQLDPKLQKAIASQYSKSQRKAIMDRKDEMNGKE